MGLIDKIIKNDQPKVDVNQLNASELQLALSILKQAAVKGEHVEVFYGMVVKLQNQYLSLVPEQK